MYAVTNNTSEVANSNGDVHSNCHSGSKGRGAGGNDKGTGCGGVQ